MRLKIAVGRRDHADIDLGAELIGSDLLQLAGLEKSQQQRLHPRRHLAKLVEEHRAVMGQFELSGLVAEGAR